MGLAGTVPKDGWPLPDHLEGFVLSNNPNISGPLPQRWALPGTMVGISLDNCTIRGTLGPLANWTMPEGVFRVLALGGNTLTGPLDPLAALPSSVATLGLQHNQLSGTIPPDLFARFPELQKLGLFFNRLSGPLPDNWTLPDSLQVRRAAGGGGSGCGNWLGELK